MYSSSIFRIFITPAVFTDITQLNYSNLTIQRVVFAFEIATKWSISKRIINGLCKRT